MVCAEFKQGVTTVNTSLGLGNGSCEMGLPVRLSFSIDTTLIPA